MAQTLRKKVDHWVRLWEKQYAKGIQTESMTLYVAKKAIEDYKENAERI